MAQIKTKVGRRSFLRNITATGGGLMLGFSWFASCQVNEEELLSMPDEWFNLNAFLKIGDNGLVTIMSPNPEGGQNVKTSMPMIIAEELDVDWKDVIVEQAPLDTDSYTRQFIGGSQALRRGWQSLRMAGATARQMLREAAARSWNVSVAEIETEGGMLIHKNSGQKSGYGEMASAASQIEVPEEVALKEIKDFKIIGHSQKNVDGLKIVTGKPLFGLDYSREGMLIAMITHPPAFGMKLKSFDDSVARNMPGIKDVFEIKVFNEDYGRQYFDTCTHMNLVAIVGESTWQVMKAKQALKIDWEPAPELSFNRDVFGNSQGVTVPSGLENTDEHLEQMSRMALKPAQVLRQDGNPDAAFKNAAKIIERSYTAPFLAHNCMEPMNFFAYVTDEKAEFIGPLQKPEYTEKTLSARLGIPLDKIDIKMSRLGGGYGRRSYAHWLVEAGIISQKVNAPVQLIYTREDDMTSGIYRPAYHAIYKAGLDEENNLIAFQVKAGGIPESPLSADRFPAGAVDNYKAEEWSINSNITVGSFRAPRSNFMAAAEQSFLDEVAETAGKDPIEFRLELLERAKNNPVGENNDYDPERYAGVLKLVREKSNWNQADPKLNRGVSAYFCHNSYAAHVLDLAMEDGKPVVEKVVCALDCGIVVNPDAAVNMAEGAITDGVGCALYGAITFKEGVPQQNNFHNYHQIRMHEAPKEIEVHFVKNEIDPTGLGEPPFPPVFAALANAMYRATGNRYYSQPYLGDQGIPG
ncbi:MAG: xanthine dehydrogenase family protein molybdopterin-binding subunit [Saprospiraceae bacterium]|nr:xanthine dehydrogenase family protein molybdopterin-binding subunit [Saprospiraceae bacterium]